MTELIFLDLEWNTAFYRNRKGERVPFHELIEVAAIKVDPVTGAMVDSFHSYVHPKVSRRIENRTYRLLPYEREELSRLLRDAPSFLDLGPDFLHWCGHAPIFIEWGSNDVTVLMKNFEYHRLSFDSDWSCQYFDLQYMYQKLCSGDLGAQPSLEKAVCELGLDTALAFHSAWNDTYYTVMVYQYMLDHIENLTLFNRPPKQHGLPPLRELELGIFDTRWACKSCAEIVHPTCPICGEVLHGGHWVRTTPTEQVLRCRCKKHRFLYLAITAQREGASWRNKLAIYKNAGSIAERYHKTCEKLRAKRCEPTPA